MAVSVRDVAVAAGVSVGTVSNVLNHAAKVAPGTVARVHLAIERLGYVRNDAARQLRAGRSRCIGVVVLDVGNPFFAEVIRGAEARAAEAGLSVLIGNSDEDPSREESYLGLFLEQRVNGVLVTPAADDLSALRRVSDAEMPVVLLDHADACGSFASVSVDDVRGGHLAAAHLLAAGRRRLAYVGGPSTIRQVRERLEGARRAVDEVPGASLELVEVPALTVLSGRDAGSGLASRPAESRPDAVFAANDLLAVGVLQAFASNGLRAPEDVALVGYDDIDFAAAAVVPLSSVRQPAQLIGYTAADLVIGDSDGDGRSVLFAPELVVRASSAGARR